MPKKQFCLASQIWDSAGMERYHSISRSICKDVDVSNYLIYFFLRGGWRGGSFSLHRHFSHIGSTSEPLFRFAFLNLMQGIILVYSTICGKSLKYVEYWMKNVPASPVVIVGNKSDIQPPVVKGELPTI